MACHSPYHHPDALAGLAVFHSGDGRGRALGLSMATHGLIYVSSVSEKGQSLPWPSQNTQPQLQRLSSRNLLCYCIRLGENGTFVYLALHSQLGVKLRLALPSGGAEHA